MHFVFVDLPKWMRWFYKGGHSGIRLHYYLWQFAALVVARRLHRTIRFERALHLTFASSYVPALISLLGIPFTWGPVGGGVSPPWRLVLAGGPRCVVYEIARLLRRAVGRYLDPLVRITWRRADLILVQNRETLDRLPRRHRGKAIIAPNATLPPGTVKISRERQAGLVITAGRLLPLKGVHLAVRAMALSRFDKTHLLVIGDGEERTKLERLAKQLGIDGRVTFTGWVSRPELMALFGKAEVFLFPSLHDECGLVVLEAMASGLVPIVLDRGGPPALAGKAGRVIRAGSPKETVSRLADEIDDVLKTPDLKSLQEQARGRAFLLQGAIDTYLTCIAVGTAV
jgi:glycosyltransferase involved in cell wall biosynthesis